MAWKNYQLLHNGSGGQPVPVKSPRPSSCLSLKFLTEAPRQGRAGQRLDREVRWPLIYRNKSAWPPRCQRIARPLADPPGRTGFRGLPSRGLGVVPQIEISGGGEGTVKTRLIGSQKCLRPQAGQMTRPGSVIASLPRSGERLPSELDRRRAPQPPSYPAFSCRA